jgi:hypothetical protein
MVLAGLVGLVLGFNQDGRSWDQSKAKSKVANVLKVEQTGEPWDKIPWLTDPDKAVEQANRDDKPVFVFFYLAKKVGPPSAPC